MASFLPTVGDYVRILSSGRSGEVVLHDPDDANLTYKVKFAEAPGVDWCRRNDVVVDASPLLFAAPNVAESKEDPARRTVAAQKGEEGEQDRNHQAPLAAPEPKVSSGPITLEVLQGQWLSGNGTQVSVAGTAVYMNGVLLPGQGVELHEDGTVVRIGLRLQVEGWAEGGGIQFRAISSGGQYMEFAPKEVWTRLESSQSRHERLRLLGYAGAAASHEAGTRGVEGCIPGTLCQWMPSSTDEGGVELLQTLILQWREPEMRRVRSGKVVPDVINRDNTGIAVELVHYIAMSIRERGFKKRNERSGHDVPVVVYEPPGTDSHRESLEVWKERVAEEHGFPPVRINDDEDMFTSLGNGHFFQALNLYACQWPALDESGKYAVGHDEDLREAIALGVSSIVLKSDTPRPVRSKIAHLLNSKADFLWTFGDDGTVDVSNVEERTAYTTQFERMSKHIPGEGAYTSKGGIYAHIMPQIL
eukprot:TRINITY_DN63351_c0_g1_i1.p1 TRINITY_DN63351_c0_g1~~TRINITY_DN63351_c0_g1_i1.p1  ORF type:complete len:474 (+),score=51.95 TRINITY_DN63351_c0_g1_i1:1-1422(+)